MRETWVQPLGWEDPLEKGIATHSSTLAWRIPWTEEPGRLQSMGSQRVSQTRLKQLSMHTHLSINRIKGPSISPRMEDGAHPALRIPAGTHRKEERGERRRPAGGMGERKDQKSRGSY